MKKIQTGIQYIDDIFNKLEFDFVKRRRLLDVGCGGGLYSKIFIEKYGLETYGIDIYENENIKNVDGLAFKRASIFQIPYQNDFFDYVFLHQVLHHIDEPKQRRRKHLEALKELKRVCKTRGVIIILEANRYNPLSFPHKVLLGGHQHFKCSYFKKLICEVFNEVKFKNFEAHVYPLRF